MLVYVFFITVDTVPEWVCQRIFPKSCQNNLACCNIYNRFSNEYTARIELAPKEIIFNKPHPAILLRISDKLVCHSILVLVPEIKRDIIFRRMQLLYELEYKLTYSQSYVNSSHY